MKRSDAVYPTYRSLKDKDSLINVYDDEKSILLCIMLIVGHDVDNGLKILSKEQKDSQGVFD
jgi:hypothetical protein